MTTAPVRSVFTEIIMDLPFSLHIRGTEPRQAIEAAVREVWSDLRAADETFSPFKPTSAVSRMNRGEECPAADSAAVNAVLDLAHQTYRITDGAFDVHYSGQLDPSGIVKSWATARAAKRLDHLDVVYYLNAGGDILVRTAASTPRWRIGIEHPHDPNLLLAVLELTSGGIATSGSAHRGNHIIAGRTGRPASGFTQVSVVGPSLVKADIAATTLMVTGAPNPALSRWLRGYEVLAVSTTAQLLATPGLAELAVDTLPAHRILDL